MNYSPVYFDERIAELIPNRQFVGCSAPRILLKRKNGSKALYTKNLKKLDIRHNSRAPRLLTFSFLEQILAQLKENP